MPSKTMRSRCIPDDVEKQLCSLEEEYREGDLTEKGYIKRKVSLISPLVGGDVRKKIEGDLQEQKFSNVEASIKAFLNGNTDSSNDNQPQRRGRKSKGRSSSPDPRTPATLRSSRKRTRASTRGKNSDNSHASESSSESEETTTTNKSKKSSGTTSIKSTNGEVHAGNTSGSTSSKEDVNNEVPENESTNNDFTDSNKDVVQEKTTRGKVKLPEEENEPMDTETESKSTISRPRRSCSQKVVYNENITRKPGNLKQDYDSDGEVTPSRKRIKRERDVSTDPNFHPNKTTVNRKMSRTVVPADRCSECLQLLETIQMFQGDSEEAVEEFVMLTDPKLNVFDDSSVVDDDAITEEERPQHRVTGYTVYDKFGHICPFDTGLIEQNKELYFSGYAKPIYTDDPSTEGGIETTRLGPINEWWTAGFDGGEDCLIGFSTAYADYYLMLPSDVYGPIKEPVMEKIHMSKIVIEFLINNPDATYEDLLNKLQTSAPPQGIPTFSEDALLRHAQFVVEQVQSYDDAADPDENLLITTPCMRAVINLAGVTFGKRSKIRTRREQIVRPKKTADTKATVTPLVEDIFEQFFQGQIQNSNKSSSSPRRRRCGVCEACQQVDCGNCPSCKNMLKFGGTGKSKQACIKRKCPNLAIQEAADNDGDEDGEDEMDRKAKALSAAETKHHSYCASKKKKTKWVGKPIGKDGTKIFYSEAIVDGVKFNSNDCVFVAPDDPSVAFYPAQIMYMWENEKNGRKSFHAHWFCRSADTVLGDTPDEQEVFIVDDCEDSPLESINSVCQVEYRPPPKNWHELGGLEESRESKSNGTTLYFQKRYNLINARFEDPPKLYIEEISNEVGFKYCRCCKEREAREKMEKACLGIQLSDDKKIKTYSSVDFKGETFNIGDSVFLPPQAFKFQAVKVNKQPNKATPKEVVDEVLYPELYRKNDYVKGSNSGTSEPFRIGYIVNIFTTASVSRDAIGNEDVKMTVKKFYRPENTHRGLPASHEADFNILYWTDEEEKVSISSVQGKCYVVYSENLTIDKEDYRTEGEHRFYFTEAYIASKSVFEDPPAKAQALGSKGKGKGKGKGKANCREEVDDKLPTYVTLKRPLRALDVFAGCGGLSEGFHQSGVCETGWAIEKENAAAQAFRLNNPKCTVFTDDCNELLRLVMDGQKKNSVGQILPQKGDVELLCGGPPCQGFSGMNRFNEREYSAFKNSLVVSYLSYCDYYRPRYFLLENVRNFFSFKKNMVLKLTLRCLLKMGYQCTFGVLQAGHYGVPQTRRRAIILAAAPGEVLPMFPEPGHVFEPRTCQLSVVIDDRKYTSNVEWTESAPYRCVTIRDALSDLPEVRNGAKAEEIAYSTEPLSHFQKMVRRGNQHILRDHVVKEMNPIVEGRMQKIPKAPGSDWRNIPNLRTQLSDGTFAEKLVYTHKDKKNGNAKNGARRGVCTCAEAKPCDPNCRQFNTLIPWCLPHTGNRHNNWAGLYGRLEWDGFFSTTITNPEPMGKQGRVLHPEQNRVVSVRECARSQGFPDAYRFYGSVLDRHRQIGNAVPPPMAKAIGEEIKKCVHKLEKMSEERLKENSQSECSSTDEADTNVESEIQSNSGQDGLSGPSVPETAKSDCLVTTSSKTGKTPKVATTSTEQLKKMSSTPGPSTSRKSKYVSPSKPGPSRIL